MTSKICNLFLTMIILCWTSQAFSAVLPPLEERYGGLAYFDPQVNVTFVANTNSQGQLSYQSAMDWAAGLDIGGITGWTLPYFTPGPTAGCDEACLIAQGLFAYLYHIRGITASAPGPFTNLGGIYWASNNNFEYSIGAYVNAQYNFDTGFGNVFFGSPTNLANAWAYKAGDPLNGLNVELSAVPLPAAIWMFGPIALGFGALRKRRNR